MNIKKKFTFITITYNHEEYIMEHLESIKYQILNFGSDMDFQLIIADDCSRDKTLKYVQYWVSQNEKLFGEVNIVTDSINKGTCYNFTKVWELIKGDYCKACAGDDVYSCNNLFSYFDELKENELVGGLPLTLIDGEIIKPKGMIFHIFASDTLYKDDFYERLKKISVINTPNTIIPVKCYKNANIFEFVRKFTVTEDFPLFIKMSEEYKPFHFLQIPKVLIYYRRTNNSTYIVKNDSFSNDKVEIFKYLISKATSFYEKIMLRNRIKCFLMQNKYLRRIINLNYYPYAVKIAFNFISIWKAYSKVDIDTAMYQQHMEFIRNNAIAVQKSCEEKI